MHVLAYSLKAKIVESQLPAVTGQRPLNSNNKGMVLSAQSVPIAAYETMEYVYHRQATISLQQRNGVLCAVREEML
jgi:hypothetical protein